MLALPQKGLKDTYAFQISLNMPALDSMLTPRVPVTPLGSLLANTISSPTANYACQCLKMAKL
jgi:hypothetical protein